MQLALEFMDAVGRAFEGKRVFVTGHTGFKGSWLCEWLLLMGAEITGYSLPPPTDPSLFLQLGLAERVRHQIGDVRNLAPLEQAIKECQPDFVFHLAAQALVRASYQKPLETFSTNVLGSVNILQALRVLNKPCAVIMVTSDKCYRNLEDGRSYVETDPLGGQDPYSASKAAAEIATASWRDSFYSPENIIAGTAPPIAIATVRAGNVIGGGDWAVDRIVPDSWRAWSTNETIKIRNPHAIRPWQHVLEPLFGYLTLAASLHESLLSRSNRLRVLCSPFNFGPTEGSHRSVQTLVEELARHWPLRRELAVESTAVGEAQKLHLSIAKAERELNWKPRWDFSRSVEAVAQWHLASDVPRERTRAQINSYRASTLR